MAPGVVDFVIIYQNAGHTRHIKMSFLEMLFVQWYIGIKNSKIWDTGNYREPDASGIHSVCRITFVCGRQLAAEGCNMHTEGLLRNYEI